MRIAFALAVLSVLLVAPAYADPAVIIRERAKELSNQNNVRQGIAAPTQPGPTPGAPNTPATPMISPGLLHFNTRLAEIRADSLVNAEQKQKLAQDIVAGAQGPKPSLVTASRLAADVSAAFGEKPLSAASRARFVRDLDAVLNPGKYPMAKIDGIVRDVQAIFQENGLARVKAVAIAEDVKLLVAEVQKGGG